MKKNTKRILSVVLSLMMMLPILTVGAMSVQAKTFVISTPEQFKNINWKNAGYGPGHTYKIGNDFTLGDNDEATCRLTKGNFTIDFNGHTVQNANNALTVIHVSGANVVLKDSKASDSKFSVRSYGAGAVQITSGTLTILNGNYGGLSDGTNNPSALHVGGGTCNVNGGFFYGETIGASCAGGTMRINNGATFRTAYMFALENFGGNIRISRANFISGTTTYGGQFAIGAYAPQSTYNFNTWLVSGSAFSPSFQTGYWNGQSQLSATPFYASMYAVAYNTPTLKVTSNVKAPAPTALNKLTAPKKKQLKATWKKKTGGVSGYELQLATNKGFTKNKKTVVISKNTAKSKTVKGLKAKKKYYVRIRTYRNFNGTKYYSKWSKLKTKKTK
ncbi:MAG: fibronectin type III domain-containing protein [Eubacterium sp.]|nr:fibronectin type III domain-containing protein [Eubacterium sp.]